MNTHAPRRPGAASQFSLKTVPIAKAVSTASATAGGATLLLAAAFVLCLAATAGCIRQPAKTGEAATVERIDARTALGAHTRTTRLEFRTQPRQVVAGQPALWSLKVLDAKAIDARSGQSKYIRSFDAGDGPLLQLIVVSKDLSYFERLRPTYKDYGHFLVEPALPRAGLYKIYAAYTPHNGKPEVAQRELSVAGDSPLPPRARLAASPLTDGWLVERASASQESEEAAELKSGEPVVMDISGYRVALMPSPSRIVTGKDTVLRFQVRDDGGQPLAALQPRDGATGHCVMLSEDTRIYLDARPANDEAGPDVVFRTRFPAPGLYKVWGQFRHRDLIVTAPFVLRVEAGAANVENPASKTKAPA